MINPNQNHSAANGAIAESDLLATDLIASADEPFVQTVEVYTLMTAQVVSEMLGVSLKTLERWRGMGEGPRFVKLSAGTVRYRAVDLNDFIKASLRDNTAQ